MDLIIGVMNGEMEDTKLSKKCAEEIRELGALLDAKIEEMKTVIISAPDGASLKTAQSLKRHIESCSRHARIPLLKNPFETADAINPAITAIENTGKKFEAVIFVGSKWAILKLCNLFCIKYGIKGMFKAVPENAKANVVDVQSNKIFEQIPQ